MKSIPSLVQRRTAWPLHLLALLLAAVGAGTLFLQEPGFGDDLTYWSFAFDLHERGLIAWQKGSFHDLRWPVWGVCWLFQAVFDFGLLSYYAEPLLYLAGGAALSFCFGKLLSRSPGVAWTCGIAFVFHPLLDTVCYRPMPDLSEGVWGAAVVLCWWFLMRAERTGRAALFSILTGASVFILESNRITGVFVVPVLVVGTLLHFPRRFFWLCSAGVFAAALYAGECLFYHQLFGDWLHNLHANLGNKGAKGTEGYRLWAAPFRFFDSLWKGNPLAPVYCVLSLAGIVAAWGATHPGTAGSEGGAAGVAAPRLHGRWRFASSTVDFARPLGRVIVLWLVVLYLEYACAPQSLWPWRPLIRDADRFLCGLAVPMAVLTALGLHALLKLPVVNRLGLPQRMAAHPLMIGGTAIVLLALITSREFFDLGFVPEMRRHLGTLTDGTRIFSHKAMREIAYLVDASAARRFIWFAPNEILRGKPELEQLAAKSDQFWYARKLVWLNTRKRLERKGLAKQEPLGSYFDAPERDWVMTRLLAKGDTPDLIFHRRRTPADPAPRILLSDAPEFQGLIPALPFEWTRRAGAPVPIGWKVPADVRGQLARLELIAGSEQVEALTLRMRFMQGAKRHTEYLLKPYLHPAPGKDFFAFQVPADAESCEVQVRFSKSAQRVQFVAGRLVLESLKR